MQLSSILVLVVILLSCGKNAYIKSDGASLLQGAVGDKKMLLCEKSQMEILTELEGSWESGCQVYGGSNSIVTKFSIDDSGVSSLSYDVYSGTSCSGLLASLSYNRVLNIGGCSGEYIKANYTTVDVLMTSQANLYTYYLNARSECGINSWSNGEIFNVAGLDCSFLLSGDPFHSRYRSFGEESFGVIHLDENGKLRIDDWTTNSGDSETSRIVDLKEGAPYVLSKI